MLEKTLRKKKVPKHVVRKCDPDYNKFGFMMVGSDLATFSPHSTHHSSHYDFFCHLFGKVIFRDLLRIIKGLQKLENPCIKLYISFDNGLHETIVSE